MGASRRGGPSARPLPLGALCLFALLALSTPVPGAQASTLKLREIYPGSAAHPAAEYVELQLAGAGPGTVAGQALSFYDAEANQVGTLPLADVANHESQRAVLLASSEAVAQLPIPAPDAGLGDDSLLNPAGGAVCLSGEEAECATWGSFPVFGPIGLSPIPDPQSANALAIGEGMALRRTIARGCPTVLDSPDDIADSHADFAEVAPAPHNNSEVPSETPCPPDTVIGAAPASPTNKTTATFAYAALPEPEEGVSFKCRLDATPFVDCTAGAAKSYSALADGSHTFQVFAEGPGGSDPSPATRTWTVDTVAPVTAIDSGPPEPSGSFSASFAFQSNEPGSSFRCSLDGEEPQLCSSPKTYFLLSEGRHAFAVWAVDAAGNPDPQGASRSFTVDASVGDLSPPDTTILSAPPNPSTLETASFTYTSTELGAGFECRLDDQGFAPCPPLGIAYSRLRNGSHAFAVRSRDRAGNLDPFPASYSWRVAAPLPRARIAKAPSGYLRLPRGAKRVKVAFRLASDEPGSSFHCRLDHRPFGPCRARIRLRVGAGRHRFEALAVDRLGNVGTAVARRIFRVQSRKGGLF